MSCNCNRNSKRGGGKKTAKGRQLCNIHKYEYICNVKDGDIMVGKMNRRTGNLKNANARCAYACENIPICKPIGSAGEKYPCKANNTVFVTQDELKEYVQMVENKPLKVDLMSSKQLRKVAKQMVEPKLKGKGGIIKPIKAKMINNANKMLVHRSIDDFKTVYSYLVHEVRVTLSVDIKNARKIASRMLKDIEKKIAIKEKKKIKKRKCEMAVKVIKEMMRMSKSNSSVERKKKNIGRKRVGFA